MINEWDVRFSTTAGKQYKKLEKSGKNPPINAAIDFLVIDLKNTGPERANWPNYSRLSDNNYHCHLRKGRPTYVACWRVLDRKLKKIEVYYVGTHEDAPY